MTLATPPIAASRTPADDAALAARFTANCRALGVDLPLPDVTAYLARDGSTTAKRDGRWLAGCSVPRLAAERMIRKETWPHRALCLLGPTHGQQLAAVLAKLPKKNALIAVFPSPDALADALACSDIAADASAGRLHVAWDESTLAAIFDRHPGLAAPRQIVRLPDADPAFVAAALPWTQSTLAAVTARHAARAGDAASRSPDTHAGCCGLVGQEFELWNDGGDALARVMRSKSEAFDAVAEAADRLAIRPPSATGSTASAVASSALHADARALSNGLSRNRVTLIDTDHPLAAADACAAEQTAAASATIADRPRPAWATSRRPWVAWLVGDDVPPFNPAFAADALLLASPVAVAAAREAGWPADRVTLAGWPNRNLPHAPGRPLALLYDLPDLDPPADIAALSSRQIVWEAIRDELCRDPFALGDDAERYVRRAPARLGLPLTDDFPVRRFIDGIVAPTFVVGVATWLAGRNVEFTLHGKGWDSIETLADRCHGPVADRRVFETIVAQSGGVIDAFLSPAHPCRSLGVPALGVFGRTPQRVTQDAKTIAAGQAAVRDTAATLTISSIASCLKTS